MFFVSPVGRRRFETVARTPAAVDCYVESEVRGFSFKLVNFSLLFFRIVPKTQQAGCSRPGCLSAFSHLLVVIPLADSGMRFSPEGRFSGVAYSSVRATGFPVSRSVNSVSQLVGAASYRAQNETYKEVDGEKRRKALPVK